MRLGEDGDDQPGDFIARQEQDYQSAVTAGLARNRQSMLSHLNDAMGRGALDKDNLDEAEELKRDLSR